MHAGLGPADLLFHIGYDKVERRVFEQEDDAYGNKLLGGVRVSGGLNFRNFPACFTEQ